MPNKPWELHFKWMQSSVRDRAAALENANQHLRSSPEGASGLPQKPERQGIPRSQEEIFFFNDGDQYLRVALPQNICYPVPNA